MSLVTIRPIKLVVVGDHTVGKTCLLTSFATNQFPTDFVPAVFGCWMSNTIEIDGQLSSLIPWDTPGLSDYDRLRPLSYPDTDVCMICFSLVDSSSFDSVQGKWYPEVNSYCPDVPIILVGTKLDLRNDKEQVETANGRTISIEEGIRMQSIGDNVVKYMECSALTQYGVKEVFEEAMRAALKYITASKSRQKKCAIM